MSPLQSPRFVALDSSHLGQWAWDRQSRDPVRREAATGFEAKLEAGGWVPLLAFHHIEELLAHGVDGIAADRIEMLHALPLVAWVAPADGHDGLGSILDVMTAEVRVVMSEPSLTALEVRDCVRPGFVCLGSGAEALSTYAGHWPYLRERSLATAAKSRDQVAIARAKAIDTRHLKISDLLQGQLRSPAETAHVFTRMQADLANEIRQRGDQRIPDASVVASDFVARVRAGGPRPEADVAAFVRELLHAKGLDEEELGPNDTLGDVDELSLFRMRLRIAAETLGLERDDLKRRVRLEQCPSAVIARDLRLYSQDQPRRLGSEPTDTYLATLAAYVDLTTVDKRTDLNIAMARQKSPAFDALMGQVAKAANYRSTLPGLPA